MSEGAGRPGEFREGWPIVLCAMLGIGLSLSSLPFYSLGPLAGELVRAFDWRLGQVMAGPSIVAATILLTSPIVGLLSDRFGVRRVVLISVPTFGLAFMAFALGTGSIAQYYATWAMVAIAGAGSLPVTWTWAVNSKFDASKGLALGLALLGTGLFAYAVKPFIAWLLPQYGWRMTYVALGCLPVFVSFPLAWVFFKPDRPPAGSKIGAEALGPGRAEFLRQWRFWVLMAALVPISFAVAGPIPNLETILAQAQLAESDVVTLASLLGLSVIAGRLAGGWLIDRLWAPAVGMALLSAAAVACWLLAGESLSFTAAATAIVLFGLGTGVEFDLMAFLVARYFGMRIYGRVYGFVYAAFALGAGAGPIYFGHMFDRSRSYSDPLILSSALLVGGAALMLTLGRYRFHPPERPTKTHIDSPSRA